RLRRRDAEGRSEGTALPIGRPLARALDGATVSGGEARQTRVVGAAHLRDAALGVDALPIGRLGDARITVAASRAGAGPPALILRLAPAVARQPAGRAPRPLA